MTRQRRRGLVIALLVLWLATLALPTAVLAPRSSAPGPVAGLNVFLIGWMGLMILVPAWFANLGFAVICRQLWREQPPRSGWAIGVGGVTLALGLDALRWKYFSVATDAVASYESGFWLWLAVIIAAGVLGIHDAQRSRPA